MPSLPSDPDASSPVNYGLSLVTCQIETSGGQISATRAKADVLVLDPGWDQAQRFVAEMKQGQRALERWMLDAMYKGNEKLKDSTRGTQGTVVSDQGGSSTTGTVKPVAGFKQVMNPEPTVPPSTSTQPRSETASAPTNPRTG
jgi:hypothetical protein